MPYGDLATLDDDAILERISAGEIMRTIAAELGVAKQSLRERLLKHPQYRDAIAAQAESLVEGATAECMDCDPDMPVIARARLRLDASHRWAAARDPANWAQKQEIRHTGVIVSVSAELGTDALALLQSVARMRNAAVLQAIEGDYVKSPDESAQSQPIVLVE